MAITDAFTRGPTRRALAQSIGIAGQARDTEAGLRSRGFGETRDILSRGSGDVIDELRTGRKDAERAVSTGEADALARLAGGYGGALDAFGRARGAVGQSGERFAPVEALAGRYGGGARLLEDALGLGGAEGAARAQEAYGQNLRSNFALDQGLEAIRRLNAASTSGGAFGGNVSRQAQEFGTGLAFSDVDAYLDRLEGYRPLEYSATTEAARGRAGADRGIADLYGREAGLAERRGLTEADLAQDRASALANLATGTSRDIASERGSLADALSRLALGESQAEIGAEDEYNQAVINALLGRAAASEAGSQSAINLGATLGGQLFKAAGSAGGFGNLFGGG